MAKVLLGANMVSVTGKLAGTVFQGGKYGTIMRSKVNPKRHPRTFYPESQSDKTLNVTLQQQRLVYFSGLWRDLSIAERNSWYDVKEQGLTGFALYMKRNVRAVMADTPFRSYTPIPPFNQNYVVLGTYYVSDTPRWGCLINTTITDQFGYYTFLYPSFPHSRGRKGHNNYTYSRRVGVLEGSLYYTMFDTPLYLDPSLTIDCMARLYDRRNHYLFDPIHAPYKGIV